MIYCDKRFLKAEKLWQYSGKGQKSSRCYFFFIYIQDLSSNYFDNIHDVLVIFIYSFMATKAFQLWKQQQAGRLPKNPTQPPPLYPFATQDLQQFGNFGHGPRQGTTAPRADTCSVTEPLNLDYQAQDERKKKRSYLYVCE